MEKSRLLLLSLPSTTLRPDPTTNCWVPKRSWGIHNIWDPKAPYKGTIEWEGREREAGIIPGVRLRIEGMLGTELLKWRRLTVDVIEGGTVSITSIPPRPSDSISRWRSHKTTEQVPFGGDLEEWLRWMGGYVPWTEIQVQDNKERFNPLWVNVDTGNNQELNLPIRLVDRLGLTATGKREIDTTDGLVERDQGEAEIIWMGKPYHVECTHCPDDKPPHIGMKLLKGNRITVDFDDDMPIADIRRIPKPGRSVREILCSLGSRFHP